VRVFQAGRRRKKVQVEEKIDAGSYRWRGEGSGTIGERTNPPRGERRSELVSGWPKARTAPRKQNKKRNAGRKGRTKDTRKEDIVTVKQHCTEDTFDYCYKGSSGGKKKVKWKPKNNGAEKLMNGGRKGSDYFHQRRAGELLRSQREIDGHLRKKNVPRHNSKKKRRKLVPKKKKKPQTAALVKRGQSSHLSWWRDRAT